MRVATEDGVLFVYDAPMPARAKREQPGFVAYWNDFVVDDVYYFDALLFSHEDAAAAIVRLCEDFDLPILSLLEGVSVWHEESIQNPAPDLLDRAWIPFTRDGVIGLMGYDPDDLPPPSSYATGPSDPGISDEPCIKIPPNQKALDIYPPPPPGSHPDDIVDVAVVSVGDCCGGCDSGIECTRSVCVGRRPCPCTCRSSHRCPTSTPSCWRCDCLPRACKCGWKCPQGNRCRRVVCRGGLCVVRAKDCDDGDPCTNDSCTPGEGCVNEHVCGDPPPNRCLRRRCEDGSCEVEARDCDDDNACTSDSCDPQEGCSHEWMCDAPDDPCLQRSCQGGGCVTVAKDCDDENPCTDDRCDPEEGGCVNESRCEDDGNACTRETCLDGDCVRELACEDENPCTSDICKTAGYGDIVCEHSPISGACDDDGNPCTEDVCAHGACTHPPGPDGAVCDDDGFICTQHVCSAGACVPEPINDGAECDDDGDPCTRHVCSSGACVTEPAISGTPCEDDGDPCTIDHCVSSSCVHWPGNDGAECEDDGNPCTDDECLNGSCVHPVKSDCTDCIPPYGPRETGWWCIDGACTPKTCAIGVASGAACPGGTVDLELTGSCTPDCWDMTVTVLEQPEHANVSVLGGAIPCDGLTSVRTVRVTVDPDAPPEPITFILNGGSGDSSSCAAEGAVTVIRVDLDVDSNRDGVIDAADDATESGWSWGAEGAGAVLLGNLDDDDWMAGHATAHHADGRTSWVDGSADMADLARLVVRSMDVPEDWGVYLTLSGDSSVTIHELAAGQPVLGYHAGGVREYELQREDVRSQDLHFGATTFQLPRSIVDSQTDVRLELRDGEGQSLCHDEIALRLTSWYIPSNLDPATTVYVRQLPPYDPLAAQSAQFVSELQAAVAGTGATVTVVNDEYYGNDVWMQDQIEIGYTSASPGSLLPVVLNSPRNRGLVDFAERELFRPNTGYYEIGVGAGTQDSFGNLEVTPPVTVEGVEYPFGRIYTGQGMQSMLRADFLPHQIVQSPITLDTDWLLVEHVDEIVTFIPDLTGPPGAFKVLIADPALGVSILESEPEPLSTFMGKYEDPDMYVAIVLATYREANLTIYAHRIEAFQVALMNALGLPDSAFVRVPVVFNFLGAGTTSPEHMSAFSLLPNPVNLIAVNGRLVAPDPFYDRFMNPFVSALGLLGYSVGDTLRFVDDWDVYHNNDGEVHCGTYVRRVPSGADWWSCDPE